MESPRERIIVALDVDSGEEAMSLVTLLKEHVGLFKVGLELLTSESITIVHRIRDGGGKVFLDTKFKDIPNTVGGASRAATRWGVRMFNVHSMGGLEMMKAALAAARQEASSLGIDCPSVLGVTVLTSIDQKMLNEQLRIPGTVQDQVLHLASLIQNAGLDGVICSPQEIEAVRASISERMLVVTPGVRPKWAALQDQKRVLTPGEAIIKGASYLVIGRPIIRPPQEIGTPVEAAIMIEEEVANALKIRGNKR
jgi:orotidine-5'-phosphate decarboxylase